MAGFLDVVFRGLGLSSQAVAVGGILFMLFVLRPGGREPGLAPLVARSLRVVIAGAAGVALAQGVLVVVQLVALADADGWPIAAVAATGYFHASVLRVLASLGLALACTVALRRGGGRGGPALAGFAGLMIASSAWMSHATGQLAHRGELFVLDGLHQLLAAAWVGGLVHLVAAAFRGGERPWMPVVLRRFSAMALGSVAALVVTGVAMSGYYVGGLLALLGTSYGLMILTKTAILGGALVLGALNFRLVRRLGQRPDTPLLRTRRFVEVEVGLGFTLLFAAASLTSLPPAADIVADRASMSEVASRFAPRWPRLTSPALAELPVADREAPRTDEDRAWSEFNHNVAGLFVLAMGLLAIVARTSWGRWARHWPLVFLGLAGFLLVRDDPGAWPLGPLGFWESMGYAEVLQHRLFVLIVIIFGVFEWMVRTGRLRSPRAALIFPLLCAVGSALLVTHSHALDDLKSEFLIEILHAPLAVAGILVGWGRWLELRLPSPGDRLPGRLWTWGLTAVGVLLILYREG